MKATNDTSRTFGLDERGVSEVIGSILVFGIVIMLLSIVQIQAIPNANEEIEYKHSQAVQQDLTQLSVAISETAATGNSRSASLKLGTTYPTRLLFYNPPPVQGRLKTTSQANISITNVQSDSSAGRYLNNVAPYNISTRALVYTANYNQYQAAPTRVREPTVYYENHSNSTIVRSSNFIDGSKINLIALGGDLSASGVSAEALEAEPLSAPANEYTVENQGGPLTIQVPTRMSWAAWNRTLEDEYASTANANGTTVSGSADGRIVSASYQPQSGAYNLLTVELESGTYTLRTGKVGFGQTQNPRPTYIVPVSTSGATATVEVRDVYNNPVSGVTLSTSLSGSYSQVTTGPDGRASIPASATSASQVTFEKDFDGDGMESFETATTSFQSGITLVDGRALSNNVIQFEVENPGTKRTIQSVQVHHITEYETLGTNLPGTKVRTIVNDGPENVTQVKVGSTPSSFSPEPTENSRAEQLSTPLAIPSGSSTIKLTVSPDFAYLTGDAVGARVTLYFEDGSKTFDVMLHSDDPDD